MGDEQMKFPCDEESRKWHEELKSKPPKSKGFLGPALRDAIHRLPAIVSNAVDKGRERRRDIHKEHEELRDNFQEKDECCVLCLQWLMLGNKFIPFKFENPGGVNIHGIRLDYCPTCGKKL